VCKLCARVKYGRRNCAVPKEICTNGSSGRRCSRRCCPPRPRSARHPPALLEMKTGEPASRDLVPRGLLHLDHVGAHESLQLRSSSMHFTTALHRLFTSGGQYELVHIGFQLPLLGDVDPVVRILLEGCRPLAQPGQRRGCRTASAPGTT